MIDLHASDPDADQIVEQYPEQMRKMVRAFRGEIGAHEVPKHSNRGPRIDKYYPSWMLTRLAAADRKAGHVTPGVPWCMFFGTWGWHHGLSKHPLGAQIGSCYNAAIRARSLGCWLDLPSDRSSDLTFACYPGCALIRLDEPLTHGPSEGHCMPVTGVNNDGRLASTCEGNSGDAVREWLRDLTDSMIRGVILPLGIKPLTEDWPRALLASGDPKRTPTR